MEKDRSQSLPENVSDGATSETKKGSKKRASFRVPVARVDRAGEMPEPESKPKAEKPSLRDEALAALAIKPREETETKKESKKEPGEPEFAHNEDTSETDNESVESESKQDLKSELPEGSLLDDTPERPEDTVDQVEEHRETVADEPPIKTEKAEEPAVEAYDPLPEYHPKPAEFSGGEVVIDLSGDKLVSERVVLLHDTEPDVEPEPMVQDATPESSEADEPDAQPSQQHDTWQPTYRSQPEQQHQGRAETAAPTPEESYKPDETPQRPEQRTEQRQMTPEESFERPVVSSAAVVQAAGGERVATQQDVEDAIYYATKAGKRSGLITGAVVAGTYEHFKHRRREKKAKKRYKQQGKALEQARKDFNFGLQEQARQNAETQARFAAAERKTQVPQPSQEAMMPTFRSAEASNVRTPEQGGAEKSAEKLIMRTPEQIAAESLEQLTVADGHRLETSAWHTIEVDSKTGKAVENPTFQYGQEFHRERAKESLPEPATTPAAQSGSPLDDLAAASQIPNASTSGGVLPPSNLPNATTQGAPSNSKDKAKAALLSLTKPKEDGNPVQSGPIWPWLLALGVVVILLIIMI